MRIKQNFSILLYLKAGHIRSNITQTHWSIPCPKYRQRYFKNTFALCKCKYTITL
uniref:Uncharacterized protein n=1 Tax=Ciona intestinalis TaxID=7719 RepID=H2Y2D5_CIOIN